MRLADLVPSQHLHVFRYQDIDHFRQGLRCASVDFVPFATVDVPIGQAVLSLPGCDIYLLQTFPRVVHALIEGSYAFVMLSMKDNPAAVFNGKDAEPCSMQYARGRAGYRAIEKQPGFYAALAFSPLMANRGWPDTQGGFRTIALSRDLELWLRASILRLFTAVSLDPDLAQAPQLGAGLVDSVLELLDEAFDSYPGLPSSQPEGIHPNLGILKSIDDLVDSNAVGPIYSGEIASRLGVSVRTLSNLMVRANGMSLHRYIRLRRLWSVRRQLLAGEPRQIKEIALANGFWHLGDFAAKYASQFGELPSSTQGQAQWRR
jgi:AraC-like DNA-binding protein